ncbi:hypothetical protein BJY21_003163 [Kineosphaera limosa]|uniref:Uncharacterized protein n=1 Tax=Kineosphaera limosa NBRC 100340 TaxID=1184609 RepID=K6WCS6_9MICO|nr:hypothetical protein [Kineosphaera limosa]NYE01979.1 hypothetical protein [Kineosphaera limosa]GAB97085.1 hypothetical protein KILIM_056_00090 [Kineosphaera limosa NBRC 100340]
MTSSATSSGSAAATALPAARRYASRLSDPVTWVTWMFVVNFLVQRISLPGLSIPLTVPLIVLFLLAGWRMGVLAIEPRRTFLWLVAAGASAFVVLPQTLLVNNLYISVNSWLFWIVFWFPACFMFVDRSRATFQRVMASVANVGVWLGGVSTAFLAVQFVGIPYRDIVADVVPARFLVSGFNTAYPFFYGSPLIKSNGWLALEPSFMSFTLGLCVMAGLLSGARVWKVAVAGVGMLCTVAGSGFAIVLVGVLVMLLNRQFHLLRFYLIPGLLLAAITIPTSMGQQLIARLGEGQSSNTSTALRTVEPYLYLVPKWIESFPRVLFGGGAGSSRELTGGAGVDGLIVPTIGKVFYDYGLFAGALLLFVVLACFVRTPEPAIGYAVLASMLIIQPPAQPLVVPAFLLSTLFAPVAWRDSRLDPLAGRVRRLRHLGRARVRRAS